MEFNVDTQSIAVSGSALSPNCEESQENGNEEEEKYGLFRNESAKTVWAQFKNVKKGQSSVTLVAQVVGEEEGEKETPESTILQLARLDAWVMTVLKCMVAEETRGGHRQREYIDTFKELLPIAMGQLSGELYDWVEAWEPEDLTTTTAEDVDGGLSVGERKKEVFNKEYQACVPVYVPETGLTYLAIQEEWFRKYVGEELGKIYDCYIAVFSDDYNQLKKLGSVGQDKYGVSVEEQGSGLENSNNPGASSGPALGSSGVGPFSSGLEYGNTPAAISVPEVAPSTVPNVPVAPLNMTQSAAEADIEPST